MKNSSLVLMLLIGLFIFQSCQFDPSGNNNSNNLVAPKIPPAAMFTMPTESFNESKSDTEEKTNFENWIHAGLNLLAWNTVVVTHMVAPTAAFANAFNHQGVFIGDATFAWTYQYQAPPGLGGQKYNITLTGQYINNEEDVAWTMTASQIGGFSNFVWYDGVVAADHSQGRFTLHQHPNNPQAFIQLDYERGASETDASLRFTNIVPNNPNNGQYIEYRTTSDDDLNRAFDVQLEAGNFLEILWNEPSGYGQVRHPFHFNDAAWHCWNSSQQNMDCE